MRYSIIRIQSLSKLINKFAFKRPICFIDSGVNNARTLNRAEADDSLTILIYAEPATAFVRINVLSRNQFTGALCTSHCNDRELYINCRVFVRRIGDDGGGGSARIFSRPFAGSRRKSVDREIKSRELSSRGKREQMLKIAHANRARARALFLHASEMTRLSAIFFTIRDTLVNVAARVTGERRKICIIERTDHTPETYASIIRH